MVKIRQVRTDQELDAAVDIQLEVFTGEQGIPRATCLEGNRDAKHVLAYEGDRPVATARVIVGEDGCAEIARVAVLPQHRGAGIGHKMVASLESLALQLDAQSITLHPHLYLESFYESLGYHRQGDDIDIVGGHQLITMTKPLES